MYPSIKKLSVFQKYYIHHVIVVLYVCGSVILSAYFLDYLEKNRFVTMANEWLKTDKILQQQYDIYVELVNSSHFMDAGSLLFVLFFLSVIGYYSIRLFYVQLMVASIKLDEAYEASEVFKRIGYAEPKKRIKFIYYHKIPIYVAEKPIMNNIEKDIKARLIPYSVYSLFPNSLISQFIGDN